MKKILIVNFWSSGGMNHYANSFIEKIKNEYSCKFLSSKKSEILKVKTFFTKTSLNPFFEIKRIINNSNLWKPEIIHFTSSHPRNIPLYYVFRKKKLVLIIHDLKPHEGEKVSKIFFHYFHLFISKFFINHYIIHSKKIINDVPFFLKRKKISIMPMPDLSYINKPPFKKDKKDKFTILFFGRILKYKGLELLISAMNDLPENKYQLFVVGEGKINFKCNKKNIIFVNRFVSDEEMKNYFSMTDITVLPYLSASQSGVAFMSLAFNKPVISTNVGALTEVVNKDNGIIIRPGSVKEIVSSIEKISKHEIYSELVRKIKINKLKNDNEVLKVIKKIYQND